MTDTLITPAADELAWAEAAQPTPRPAWWDLVQTACDEMAAALRSGDLARVTAASARAAEAAEAAGANAHRDITLALVSLIQAEIEAAKSEASDD